MKTITSVQVAIACLMFLPLSGDSIAQPPDADSEISKLKHQIIEIQNRGKVGVRNLCVCKSIATYGAFVKLPEPKVPMGSKLLIYSAVGRIANPSVAERNKNRGRAAKHHGS